MTELLVIWRLARWVKISADDILLFFFFFRKKKKNKKKTGFRDFLKLARKKIIFHANCIGRQLERNVNAYFLGKVRKYHQFIICLISQGNCEG